MILEEAIKRLRKLTQQSDDSLLCDRLLYISRGVEGHFERAANLNRTFSMTLLKL